MIRCAYDPCFYPFAYACVPSQVYPDPVRVLTIGVPIEKLLEDPNGPWAIENSVELCGGTYVKQLNEM